jgi:hypothetical protein
MKKEVSCTLSLESLSDKDKDVLITDLPFAPFILKTFIFRTSTEKLLNIFL